MAYTYYDIESPDVIAEIVNNIFPGATTVFDKEVYHNLDANIKKKLEVLQDRLEFIFNLKVLEDDIKDKHNNTKEYKTNADGAIICIEQFKCLYLGSDFAGVNYDINALRIYLLISCIDCIAGQAKYISAFEFMKQKLEGNKEISLNSLSDLENEYKDKYGLSRNFVKLFTEELPKEISDIWLENFVVCGTEFNKKTKESEINTASSKSWEEKTPYEKMKKIANELYQMRSSFTHSSIRSLSPTLELRRCPRNHKSHIITMNSDFMLDKMLIGTVRALAYNLVYKEYRTSDKTDLSDNIFYPDRIDILNSFFYEERKSKN